MTSSATESTAAATQKADRELKSKHRAMWALGDYPSVSSDLLPELGRVLVEATSISATDRVLDVAAGTGNVAIPAALTGAQVVAADLTPELFASGRRRAASSGAELVWEQADVEALPFEDGSFDVVVSCVGAMFAPHHQASADEIVRVCRSGARIGFVNWTPRGFIGQMFARMKPYAPPPPPGAQPPPLWGDADHVRALFGERVTDVSAERRALRVDHFDTPEAFRDYFKSKYGPTIAIYRNLADDAERVAALDQELADLAADFGLHDGGAMDWEYLLFTARTR